MWRQIKLAFSHKERLDGPIQAILFITGRCNGRCVHCFNWRELDQAEGGLELDEFERLSKEMGQLLTLGLSGGEPFLRDDIAEIYALFSANNGLEEIDIPTNGLLPDRICARVRDMLLQHRPTRIAISLSLDGLEDLDDRIRGVPGSFAKAQETYRGLVRLKSEFEGRPLIKIATTLCDWNVRQIPDLIAWVKSEMPAADFHNFEIIRGSPADNTIGPPAVEDLEQVIPAIFEAWRGYAFYGRGQPFQSWLAMGLKRFVFTMYLHILQQRKQLVPCFAGHTSVVVDACGRVYFCELLKPIGSLHEAPLRDLLCSERAETMRASIARGECFCVHSCFQQKNVFLNPRLWPYVLRYVLTGRFALPAASHIRPVEGQG